MTTDLRMTMQDIAALARVRRPVVTMWRKRDAATPIPFPVSRRDPDGQERFAIDDVVTYLEATGRGNNPEARADAAAYAMWQGRPDERRATAQTLSALLALRHLTGRPLTGLAADEILDLADETDPDDDFLFGEIAASTDPVAAAATAEELIEAAWDVQQAHAKVVDERFRAAWRPLAESTLTHQAQALTRSLVGALARDHGEDCPVMDPTGCAADVFVHALADTDHPAWLIRGTGEVARLTRRLLALAGHPARLIEPDDWSVTGPVVHLMVLPPADRLDADTSECWQAIDSLQVQMDPSQRAVVLAPAALLTDPLDDETPRDDLLRDGRVRAVVRLPAGLRPARAREHLALWILGAPDSDDLGERRTGVADLSGLTLDGATVGGLVDDILACLRGPDAARRRAWAHLALIPTRTLLARTGSLVAGIRHQRSAHGGAVDQVLELRTALDQAGMADRILADPDDRPARPVSLATALARGWLRHLPGQRLDLDHTPSGRLPVAVPAGRSGWTILHLDRLSVALGRDLRLTEPGDVVVTTQPTPDAWVDEAGGTVVAYPGFALRPKPGGPITGHALAAAIRARTGDRTPWRDWSVPQPPPDQVDALETALAAIATDRAALVRRLTALDRALTLLTETVGVGHAKLTPPTPTRGA